SLGGPNAGGNDAFVSKYDAAGNFQWTRQLGTSSDEFSYGVSAGGAGNDYISGYTFGRLGGPTARPIDARVAHLFGAAVPAPAAPEPATTVLAAFAAVAGIGRFRRRFLPACSQLPAGITAAGRESFSRPRNSPGGFSSDFALSDGDRNDR